MFGGECHFDVAAAAKTIEKIFIIKFLSNVHGS